MITAAQKQRKNRNTRRMYLVDNTDQRLRSYLTVLVVNARARYDDASVSGRDCPADHPREEIDGDSHLRALLAAYVIANGLVRL